MALPWLRILDAVLGVTDIAMSRRPPRPGGSDDRALAASSPPAAGALEARLAGVVVAALKEAFDRDTRRLDLERERAEADRQRAERALRLEWLRQAADREIGRLRLIAGLAAAAWLGTLLFASRVTGGGVAGRALLGAGWALLLAALATALSGQAGVIKVVERAQAGRDEPFEAGVAGAVASWLIVAGLGLVAVAALVT